ncbi:MAG: helix-turn-helix transcriptional regulator [Cyanobacteria bacterium P01_A01_bin.40]
MTLFHNNQSTIKPLIEQARKMLDNPHQLMVDIAFSCGFSDQAHFCRVFKNIEGVSPKKYRR